ncbi:MAG: RIP metalloprotease RseP [Rikenellaceae bacterium]
MEILVKVVQFFLCFTLLVGIHEFGHFIAARIFKIRVEKFYIFFDPWFSIFKIKKGDTEYGLGWLPLGGYCKIAGMIDESMDKEQMAQPAKEDEFRSKPAWQRLIVMLAGVTLNIVLAIMIYIGVSYTWGDKYFANEDAKWGYNFSEAGHDLGFEDGDKFISIGGEVIDNTDKIPSLMILADSDREVIVERGGEEVSLTIGLDKLVELRKEKGYMDLFELRMPFIIDSVARPSAAELMRGDEIVAFGGQRMVSYSDYRAALSGAKDSVVVLSVLRSGEEVDVSVAVDSEGVIGVTVLNPYTLRTQKYTLLESIPAGFRKAGSTVSSYWEQIRLIVQPKTKMYEELGGFVAIGNMFSNVWNWYDFWLKTAFLSIVLAVMNVLPIPGLDGGHSLFTLWEIITGRKPSDKFLERAQYVGMILLLTLLLYANGNDFYRLLFK